MKKTLLIGVATILTLTSFEAAMAAPAKTSVRERIEQEAGKQKKLSEYVDLKGAKNATEVNKIVASKMSEVANERKAVVDSNALELAMGRTLKFSVAGEAKNITVLSITRTILQVDAALKVIREDLGRGTIKLSEADMQTLALKERGVNAAIRGLSTLARTSEMDLVRTEDVQQNIDVLNRQMSMIPDILSGKMSAQEATSHITILELAAKAKESLGREGLGDQAMDKAFDVYHKDKAEQKEKELKDCV